MTKAYTVICISLYTEDDRALVKLVDTLKARGISNASKSRVIREALRAISVDDLAARITHR